MEKLISRLMLPKVWQKAERSMQEHAPARNTKMGQRGTSSGVGIASARPCASAAAAEDAASSSACSNAASFSSPPASSAASRAAASAAASEMRALAPPTARAASERYSPLRGATTSQRARSERRDAQRCALVERVWVTHPWFRAK